MQEPINPDHKRENKSIKYMCFNLHLCTKHNLAKTKLHEHNACNKFKFRYLQIIHEFCSHHDTSDQQPMNVERIDRQGGLLLSKPIEINVSND